LGDDSNIFENKNSSVFKNDSKNKEHQANGFDYELHNIII